MVRNSLRQFLEFFDRVYVINLPERTDRRHEMEIELGSSDKVQFFPAIRPTRIAAPFYNPGVEGCSRSHLAVLRDAREHAFARVLILEDDAEFIGRVEYTLAEMSKTQWGMVQFGHITGPVDPSIISRDPVLLETDLCVFGAHCYGVSKIALHPLISLFETQHRGMNDGWLAPMPADYTLNVFRFLHPTIPCFVVAPSLVRQRPSRSNIQLGAG